MQARLRRIQPLVELRIPFDVSRAELDAIDRGARDPDLDSVTAAAREIAIAEDRAIFHGYKAAHITGICEAAGVGGGAARQQPCRLSGRGVDGAHQAARRGHRRPLRRRAERAALQGSLVAHRQRLSDHQPRPAPGRRRHRLGAGLDGGLVISQRGGDFELTVGQDFSIGYLEHDPERVRLYIEESFTFLILTEQAAIPLSIGGKKG